MVNLNVEPAPTWLSTHSRPPRSSMSFRASARPSPVPSTFFSALPTSPELLEDRLLILGGDADPGIAHRDLDGPVHGGGRDPDTPTCGRELDRVGQQIQDDLPDLPLVRADVLDLLGHGQLQRDAVPPGALADEGQGILERRRQVDVRHLELHPAGLDLREVEDLVDEGQEVLPGGVDVLQVLVLFFVEVAEQPFAQDLREPEDGVQRRTQLVGHVREELGLVPAGDFQLAALVLDLVKEPGILDRQG